MITKDYSTASEQEFRDRIAAFEAAPTPPEVREAAVIEEVARAIGDVIADDTESVLSAVDWDQCRRLAAAAVAVYRATQDGGAEEAVRRQVAEYAWSNGYESCRRGDQKRNPYRAALAPQAGDGAR